MTLRDGKETSEVRHCILSQKLTGKEFAAAAHRALVALYPAQYVHVGNAIRIRSTNLGGDGNDWLFGGLGTDTLVGGKGKNRLFQT